MKKEEIKKAVATGNNEYWLTKETFNELVEEGATGIQVEDNDVLRINLRSGDVIGIRMGGEKVISKDLTMSKIQLMYFNNIYDVANIKGNEIGCQIL